MTKIINKLRELSVPDTLSILLFSRGRGRGHAYPDIEIARDISRLRTTVNVLFVSYATGADTFRSAGFPVIDLQLPEKNNYMDTLIRASGIIQKIAPDIVLSHEEFAAIPAARIHGIPSIFISAWLPEPETIAANSIEMSNAILLLERPGIFPVSGRCREIVNYLGPIVRRMAFTPGDREHLRRAMKISPEALVVTAIPGGWATEERVPIAQVVLDAFKQLQRPKALHWVSQHDQHLLQGMAGESPEIVVHGYVDCIEKFMALSDVVITKGTYGTTMEAASLGIPTISLSGGNNPIDEILVPRIKSNFAFSARAADAETLADCLESIARTPLAQRCAALNLHRNGTLPVAEAILGLTRALCSKRQEEHVSPHHGPHATVSTLSIR